MRTSLFVTLCGIFIIASLTSCRHGFIKYRNISDNTVFSLSTSIAGRHKGDTIKHRLVIDSIMTNISDKKDTVTYQSFDGSTFKEITKTKGLKKGDLVRDALHRIVTVKKIAYAK